MRPTVLLIVLVLATSVFLCVFGHAEEARPTVDELERRLETVAGAERTAVLLDLSKMVGPSKPEEARSYAEQALTLALKQGDRRHQADATLCLARACYFAGGDVRPALQYAEEALLIFQELGDRESVASIHQNIAVFCRRISEYDRALEHLQASLEIEQELGRSAYEARVLSTIASVHEDRGDYLKALEMYRQASEVFTRLDLADDIANTQGNIGSCLFHLGDYDQALEHLHQALAIDESTASNRNGYASRLQTSALVFKNLGQPERALEYLEKARLVYEEINNPAGESLLHLTIGNLHFVSDDLAGAESSYQRSLELSRQLGNSSMVAAALNSLGLVHRAREEYSSALELHRQALTISEELGDLNTIATSCQNIGLALWGLDRPAEAQVSLERALATAKQIKIDSRIEEITRNLSDVHAAQGELQLALDYYKESAETKSRIFNERSSRTIEELQARYEADAREQKIKLLEKENQIRQLQASRAQLRANLMMAGVGVLVIALGVIGHRYRFLLGFWRHRSRIGHFKIVEQIAIGGMGIVYRAEDITSGSKPCALKVIRDEYAGDTTVRRRFLNEAATVDRLDHANIVRVHERGEHDGRLFMAMEMLEGQSLAHLIETGTPLAVESCLHILAQLAEVVQVIHSKGILHRDLKPANIFLVANDDDPYFVKLLDFGLARAESFTRLTETGAIVGTIAYLPPEQISQQVFTAASDIYALGVVSYELLTLKPAFPGDLPVTIIRQILEAKPIRPIEYRSDIDPEIDDLVLSMMARSPDDRPSDNAVRRRIAEIQARLSG